MSALPPKTISGIQGREDERVIPMTRRPDGTFRKERKIRPGYTPPEDVAKYTNRVLESVRPITPTAPAPSAAAANSTPKSKAQLKNDKRKAKRKEEATAAELAGYPTAQPTTNDNSSAATTTTTVAADSKAAAESTESSATGPVDPEKKLRALNKKLRQVEQLKERQVKGETMLPEQLEKIEKLDDLLAQIAELSM